MESNLEHKFLTPTVQFNSDVHQVKAATIGTLTITLDAGHQVKAVTIGTLTITLDAGHQVKAVTIGTLTITLAAGRATATKSTIHNFDTVTQSVYSNFTN